MSIPRKLVPDSPGDVKAIHFWHGQIEQDDVRAMELDCFQCLGAATDGNCLKTPQAKQNGHRIARVCIVVNDYDT